MRRALAAMLLSAFANTAPATAAGDECPGAAQGFRRLKHDDLEFAYRWEPAELKVGQFFTAEVVACGAWQGDRVAIDATMPAHGHGMNYRPKAERIGAGHYRFTGLMLHMAGTWRLTFTHYRTDVGIQLTHDVDLKR